MNTINTEDLEYSYMSHGFWGGFGTYMGNHEINKTVVNFPQGNNTAPNASLMSIKVARTTTSTNDVSQINSSNESYMFSTTFLQTKITQV